MVPSLLGDRKHSLNKLGALGHQGREIPVEGSNRGEPGVASPWSVIAIGFKLIEERSDEGCIELIKVEIRGGPIERFFCKAQ